VPAAVVTSNHASQISITAPTTNAVPAQGRCRATAQPAVSRLISSIRSNPAQATFQLSASYRTGNVSATTAIHPTKAATAVSDAETTNGRCHRLARAGTARVGLVRET